MAHIHRSGKGWRAEVQKKGVRKSRTFNLKSEASAWAAEQETEIASQASAGLSTDTRTFHALLDRFIKTECPKRKGGDTEEKRLGYLKKQIEDLPLKQVNQTVLAEWRDKRLKTVKGSTVRREMTLLGALFDVAVREWRLYKESPLKDVSKPPDEPARTRLIKQDEIDAVVAQLNYRDDLPVVQEKQKIAVMFLIAIETGMRAGEIQRAIITGRVAHLGKTKNGDARDVPLSTRAVELYGKLGSKKVNGKTRDTEFRRSRKEAGLSGFTFHDSRAVALTRLSKKLDVLELARMIGHRSPQSLMTYYRQSAEDTAAKLG